MASANQWQGVSVESQRQMCDFLMDIGFGIYSQPRELGVAAEPDDFYSDWQVNNRKPELIKLMRKAQKGIVKLYTLLYEIGKHGTIDGQSLRVAAVDLKISKSVLTTFNAASTSPLSLHGES